MDNCKAYLKNSDFVREDEVKFSKFFTINLDENPKEFIKVFAKFVENSDEKRVGIIGLGEIGRNFAKKAKAFDCEVVYYSTSGKNSNSEYKSISLEELLKTSDIISIHAPLNENTKNLLTYENMKNMKDGAILLNLGRGGIINENDLAKLIDEKEIYCGIDVVSKEPIEESNPLLKVKNKNRLLLTPHIGWASIEARTRLVNMVALNIGDFLKQFI